MPLQISVKIYNLATMAAIQSEGRDDFEKRGLQSHEIFDVDP